jgi:hypothetical protein
MNTEITIQDIFHVFWNEYKKKYKPSPAQAKAAHHIMACKTGEMGGHISICNDCGTITYHYNSCRDRHCPMCQKIPMEKWVDARKDDVIDAPYFHVVFTVPEELNSLIYSNQKVMYKLFFTAVAETLTELTLDKKYLGAKIGFINVLHTWGQQMNYHPHIHSIVMGGGINQAGQWKESKDSFLIPIRVLSRKFKGKFLYYLNELYKNKKLEFHGTAMQYQNRYNYKELMNTCYKKEWVPYCKESFQGARSVIEYLGRYTHRIAITNSRIIGIQEGNVTFRAKNYKDRSKWITVTISGVEFIRRFLMHVLPKRFVKLRSYGLLSNRGKKKLKIYRIIHNRYVYKSTLKGLTTRDIVLKVFGKDISKCPCCGSSNYSNAGKFRIHSRERP